MKFMKIIICLLSVLATIYSHAQVVVSTFAEIGKEYFFIGHVNTPQNNYALIFDATGKNDKLLLKEFDQSFVSTENNFNITVNGKAWQDVFEKFPSILIENSDNNLRQVQLMAEKKGVFNYYQGTLDMNNLNKGVYDMKENYTMDLSDFKNTTSLYVHNNQFITLSTSSSEKTFTAYAFTPQKSEIRTFLVPDQYVFNNANNTRCCGSMLNPELSSRYFPDLNGIWMDGENIFLISPKKNSANAGISSKNPIEILQLNLTSQSAKLHKIDVPDSKTVDYAIIDNKIFVAADTRNSLKVLEFNYMDGNSKLIVNIEYDENTEFRFFDRSYYKDHSRNQTEQTTSEKFGKSLSTLVLDVDPLQNGLYEFSISGAKYRDPDGFAKIMTTVLVGTITGALTGISFTPNFGYANLQPLLTTTTFQLNPQNYQMQAVDDFSSHDLYDKSLSINDLLNKKTAIGELAENVVIFKDNNEIYTVIDFNQQKNLPEN